MRRAGTTFTRPRDWSASYQGRYASGSDISTRLSYWVRGLEALTNQIWRSPWPIRIIGACADSLVLERILLLAVATRGFLCLTGYKIWVSLEPRAHGGKSVEVNRECGQRLAQESRRGRSLARRGRGMPPPAGSRDACQSRR